MAQNVHKSAQTVQKGAQKGRPGHGTAAKNRELPALRPFQVAKPISSAKAEQSRAATEP